MRLIYQVSDCHGVKVQKQNDVHFCTHPHCLRICGVKTKFVGIKKLLAFAILLFVWCTNDFSSAPISSSRLQRVNPIDCKAKVVEVADVQLTDSAIALELINQKCILPNVAVAQFRVETSYITGKGFLPYSSPVCVRCKNLGGIRFRIENSKGIGFSEDSLHYVIYKSYRDCISDYIRIQDSYLAKIHGHYAEDSSYVNLLKQIKK